MGYESGKTLLRKNGKFITATGPVEWVGDKLLTPFEQIVLVGKFIWYSTFKNYIPGSHPYYHFATPMNFGDAVISKFAFENNIHPHIERTVDFNDIAGLNEV